METEPQLNLSKPNLYMKIKIDQTHALNMSQAKLEFWLWLECDVKIDNSNGPGS